MIDSGMPVDADALVSVDADALVSVDADALVSVDAHVGDAHAPATTPPTGAAPGWFKQIGVGTPIEGTADYLILWVETHGHKPDIAECHWPCLEDEHNVGWCGGSLTGAFGEWCFENPADPMTKANSGRYLVESGPGKDDVGPPQRGHTHPGSTANPGGEGHPHLYDCEEYCWQTQGTFGMCHKTEAKVTCGNSEEVWSAYCLCYD